MRCEFVLPLSQIIDSGDNEAIESIHEATTMLLGAQCSLAYGGKQDDEELMWSQLEDGQLIEFIRQLAKARALHSVRVGQQNTFVAAARVFVDRVLARPGLLRFMRVQQTIKETYEALQSHEDRQCEMVTDTRKVVNDHAQRNRAGESYFVYEMTAIKKTKLSDIDIAVKWLVIKDKG